MDGRERELFALLEPSVLSQGVKLVEVGLGGARGAARVRIVIHSPEGVSHADCARVSAACGEILEEAGPFGRSYVLEVSSPGVARVLKEEREFEVFRGLPVRVRIREEALERAGVCAGTRPGGSVVLREEDGTESVIPWASVVRARLAVPVPRGFGGKRR